MNRWVRRFLQLFVCAGLFWPVFSFAQDQSVPQGNSAKPQSTKEVKKRDKKLQKELSLDDSDWLLNQVPDIITSEERRAFLELGTEEEREQFIERTFWDPRNPEPESPVNTAREEHYRRLAYADEHFASGIPGRKTDRGHIYIIWGPPDEIESHPTGGTYDRSPQQGGGSSTAHAWELWRYRHLEGIGENI